MNRHWLSALVAATDPFPADRNLPFEESDGFGNDLLGVTMAKHIGGQSINPSIARQTHKPAMGSEDLPSRPTIYGGLPMIMMSSFLLAASHLALAPAETAALETVLRAEATNALPGARLCLLKRLVGTSSTIGTPTDPSFRIAGRQDLLPILKELEDNKTSAGALTKNDTRAFKRLGWKLVSANQRSGCGYWISLSVPTVNERYGLVHARVSEQPAVGISRYYLMEHLEEGWTVIAIVKGDIVVS